jgi:hypothetical protein
MWKRVVQAALMGAAVGMALAGCNRAMPTSEPDGPLTTPTLGQPVGGEYSATAMALQAEVEATALALRANPTPTAPVGGPTIPDSTGPGLSPTQRTGDCPVPEGFTLHERTGFCVSAPADWLAWNVDGNSAVALNTTPRQVVSFEPPWVDEGATCRLTVYITTGESLDDHLARRHAAFAGSPMYESVGGIAPNSLGGLSTMGFWWRSADDEESGGLYAAALGPSRLVHISYGGSRCPYENLEPVLRTLRFQTGT